ncbi:hypothetical protein YC2023_022272 [Brassica napus]
MHFLQHRDLAGPKVFPANPITNLDRIDGIVHVEEDDYRSPLNERFNHHLSPCFSTKPTHQPSNRQSHQITNAKPMRRRSFVSASATVSAPQRETDPKKHVSGIDSMRPNFPLDSVARSMGLAPKVTSMIRMNVSANLGGDKLKTIDKLKAGVLVGLVYFVFYVH